MTVVIAGMFGIIVLVVVLVAKDYRDTKIRTLIKAYLVFNRKKKCTAKEISDFITSNDFGLNRSLCNARVIGHMLRKGMVNRNHILSEVECETVNNLKYYWVD